jgi:hypothetical protein
VNLRAISHAPLSLCLENPVEDYDPHNPRRHIITSPGLRAEFITGDTTEYEREIAKKTFKFNGLPVGEEDGLPVDPIYRISSWDSTMQQWDPKTQKKAEELLVKSPYNGSAFIVVDEPKRPAPWKGSDSIRSVKKLIELVTETGSDAEEVLAYEIENKNRLEVVEALSVVIGGPIEDDAVVVSA